MTITWNISEMPSDANGGVHEMHDLTHKVARSHAEAWSDAWNRRDLDAQSKMLLAFRFGVDGSTAVSCELTGII